MNKTYNLVWSAVRGAYVATHECAKSKGKPSSTRKALAAADLMLGLMGALGGLYGLGVSGHALAAPPTPAVPAASALPTGGQVAAGAASIAQTGNRMDVTQTSQKAVVNWQTFNIGSAAHVNFAQPNASSVALNRVLSSDPSAIYGKLTANGQVFLVNQAGVLFGAGSRVDVGGLVASTMDVSDTDFMNGRYSFGSGPGSIPNGTVLNQGTITAAQGGYVALLSPEVRNEGIISASMGTVLLAGVDAVTLSHDSTGLQYAVDKGAVQALVENKGLVQADGGQVILSARAANQLASAVINNSGTIEAKGLIAKGGKIMLEADHITLASGSTLDASGATGGGTVLVGGDWQGSGTLRQATAVSMDKGVSINVSATQSGNGGKAVLWSDVTKDGSVTRVDGEILAKGGALGGDGGKVETSGHKLKIGDTASVNTSGASGSKSGEWLLDPIDFTIGAGGDMTGAALTTALGSNNITITTTPSCVITGGAVACTGYAQTSAGTTGDIIFNDAVSWSTNTLTLSAYRNIAVNNTLAVSGNAGLTLTTNTGLATGKDIGYLKMQQGAGSFGGKINWTSSGALSMNGSTYSKVGTQTELAAVTGSNNYFLANDIALTGTWTPLAAYSGVFDGMGHTLSNLTTTGTADEKGLFSRINGATLQNIGITTGSISGGNKVGGFVGYAYGTSYLRNLFTASAVTVSPDGSADRESIGGIVGLWEGAELYLVDTTNGANINSPTGAAKKIAKVGGLVGNVNYGFVAIKASSNTGTIIGGAVANKDNLNTLLLGYNIGGLVGYSSYPLNINNSTRADGLTNSGAVYGYSRVGGIVGGWILGQGTFTTSYVTNSGNISGYEGIGGIVGTASGANLGSTITYAANQGNITAGSNAAGGLFGQLAASGGSGGITLSKSYNQGTVLGKAWGQVGGLAGYVGTVGQNGIWVEYSYNTGSVTNDNSSSGGGAETASLVGGLIGEAINAGGADTTYIKTQDVYNAGTVTSGATAKVGGIVGKLSFYTSNYQNPGSARWYPISNTYYLSGSVIAGSTPTDVSYGQMYGGTTNGGSVTAETAAFIKTTTNYTGTVYSVIAGVNGGYPIITDFAPVTPVTFTFLRNTTKTYGVTAPALVAGTDFSLTGCSACLTLSFNSTTLGQWANAGDYLYSTSNLFTLGGSSSGYSISYAGTAYKMTVTPATLTVSGAAINNKTYTGTNTATFSNQGSLSGILNSDAVSINAGTTTASFASVNKADGIAVTTSYALTGAKAGNYTVTNPTGLTANITAAPLTIAASNRTKSYGDALTLGTASFTPTGLQNSETIGGVTLAATGGTAATDNAGSYTITPSAATGGTFTASNYSITYTPNSGTLTVDKALITLKADNRTKTYGSALTLGTTAYGITVGSLKNTDTITGLTLTASGGTADVDAVGGYTITPSAASGTGGFNTTNYTISYSTGSLTVDKAPLTITANNASKIYDAVAYSGGNGVTYSPFVLGQDITALGGALVFTTGTSHGATNYSAGGYTIVPSGYTSANYAFTYVPGTLTINKKTVTLSAAKAYDGNTTLGAGTVTIDTGISGQALTYSGATSFSKNVADNATNYIAALTLVNGTGGTATNYQLPATLNAASAPVTLTKKDVSVTSVNIADKVYDGTTNASSVQSTVLSGVVAADSANVNTTGTLEAFGGKDVGNYSIQVTGLTLSGSEAGNYNLTGGTSATDSSVAITKKTVTLSASKTYDGSTSLTGFVTLGTGVTVGGVTETLTYTGAVANSSHVAANGSNFIASGIALANATDASGGVATNYQLPVLNNANAPVTISARSITPTLTNTGTTKAYDGDVTSAITPTYSFTNLATGDSAATLTNTSKVFDSKDAGVATLVTVSGLAISGITGTNSSAASDYALSTNSLTTAATITPKTLTISGLASGNKVYDGSASATANITNWGSVSTGVTTGLGTETLVLNTGTASFSDKTKANGKTVTAIGYALANGTNGGLASNYQLSSTQSTTTANITAKTITLAGSTGVTKTYDGRTSMTVGTNGYANLVGVESGDTVTIAGAPVFDSANQGARAITQNTVAIAGTDAANYTLSWTNGSGTINAAPLTVTANADANFVTQSVTGVGAYKGVSYSGFVNGEGTGVLGGALSINRAGTDTLAGTYANALAPSGLTANNGNYTITYAPGSYTIVPANQLLVTVQNASTTYGTAATYTVTSAKYLTCSLADCSAGGSVNNIATLTTASPPGTNFTYTDGASGTASFTLGAVSPQSSTAGQIKAGNYAIGASSITESSANFSNNLVVVGALAVNQKALTATATGVSKTYDGNTSMNGVTLGLTGLETNDVVTVSGNGAFAQKNVGTNLAYTVSSVTLGSTDSANYYLSGGSTLSGANGAIAQKEVTLAGARTYDGTRTLGNGTVTITTGVGSETLTYSAATASTKNVGTGNFIDAITLGNEAGATAASGGLASNYRLPNLTAASAGNTVTLAKKSLTLGASTAANKTYDGTNSATLTVGALQGLVDGEALSLTAVGTFDNANVGIGKTVGIQLALADGAGGLAGNYSISDSTTTANINPVPFVPTPQPDGPTAPKPPPPTVPEPQEPVNPPGPGGTPPSGGDPTGTPGPGGTPPGGDPTGTPGPGGTPPPGGDPTGTPGPGGTPPPGGDPTGTPGPGGTPPPGGDPTGTPGPGGSGPALLTLNSLGEVSASAGSSQSSAGRSGGVGGEQGGFVSVQTFGNLTIPKGSLFSFTLPKDTFKHSDPKVSVVLEARGADGRALPDWLNFEPGTGRFTGKPPEGLAQFVVIIFARDNTGNEASTKVELKFQ